LQLLQYWLTRNLKRRHLDEGQRAMVAAKIANLGHGGDRKSDQAANLPLEPDISPSPPPVSQPAAAEVFTRVNSAADLSERTKHLAEIHAAPAWL
jgi:hypothetical protein